MKSFSTRTTIQATPERIWRLLTDAPAYPAWNPTVEWVDGRIAKGERIKVHAKVSPGRAFPVKVSEFVTNTRMVWSSRMPLGLFKGARTFTLTKVPGDAVEFSMSEVFTGPLAGLIGKSIPDLQPSFDAFAQALKAKAEAHPAR
ncbi:SRPBCC domain-containing protein [Pyxidicoccus xibeiensis]|uniref:SRPBCC domain-containing protein n=1 Tax=Pyxidicoccus xibeiensis TaxID=2906759 RepID=UPI0020A7F44B|nr:SRPBCC domain-containing protein [Pyxidicoccus xibeiensis]MCP3142457.1 SRPBCC domain-containing protein [Pyxidicoccus xibeiensis]